MTTLLIVFCVSGLLLAAVSVPLIRGNIGPNPFYGFRVPKTLADPAIWYPVNAYAARRLLVVGIATILLATALYFVPGIRIDTYAWSVAAVALGGLLISIVQSFYYLHTFPDPTNR
jgi:uncharacterized membrane protein